MQPEPFILFISPHVRRRSIGGLGSICLALVLAGSSPAAAGSAKSTIPEPQTLCVVVLPFQNATGESAWDDWRQALPALVRSCLGGTEFMRASRWKEIQPVLGRAGWTHGSAVDSTLARQVAQELKAGFVIWGSYRHQTNGWAVDVRLLRANSEAAPVELEFNSPRWVDLAESLALGVATQLDRPIADDERQTWKLRVTDSEPAAGCLAKAIALENQEAPVSDQEKAWREVLAADPRCGMAHGSLCRILARAERKDDWETAAREFVRQQPGLCGAHLELTWLFLSNHDQKGVERELVEALRVHRGCPTASVLAFLSLGCFEQRWVDLKKILERAHAERPDNADTIILLACARAQCGEIEGARELLSAIRDLPEENEYVDIALLGAATLTGELELAGRELTRLGPKAAENELIRDTLASIKLSVRDEDLNRSNAPVVRPHNYAPGELSAELDRRLSPEERKEVVNPIEITPEIIAEAHRLTIGLTNDTLRALALFSEVARRGRGPGDPGVRTAGEALKDSGDPQAGFSCQEYAKLFVALARALGLEASVVHVERCADGSIGFHDCAALFLEGQGLLIDPAWRAFGIPHQAFIVLDDVQAIAHQAMQSGDGVPDLRRLRAGLKLNPEDRWTRLQFVRGMAQAGEHEVAVAELHKVRATGVEGWDGHVAAAELEMARERWWLALAELQRAHTLSPSNPVVHFRLANVLAQLKDTDKSNQHMEKAVELDRGELSREFLRENASIIAMNQAFARGRSGGPVALAGLQRQAEQGDLAAQFALAKILFEQKPPRTEEGMRWLLAAARQGEAQAQFHYARNLILLRGAKAAQEAKQWLMRSAEQDNAEAQYRLGLILYEGKLVPGDRVEGAKWILLAAAADNSDARSLLKEMQLFLKPEEMAEARKRADGFQSRQQAITTPQK